MSNPVFDLDSWDPLFKVSDDMAVDMDGNWSVRIGDGLAMDMDTGDIHFTTSWSSDDSDSWSSDELDDEFDEYDEFED